jgi:hypothetical protein
LSLRGGIVFDALLFDIVERGKRNVDGGVLA